MPSITNLGNRFKLRINFLQNTYDGNGLMENEKRQGSRRRWGVDNTKE